MTPIRLAFSVVGPGVGNLGDSLGPLLVAAYSGQEILPGARASPRRRFTSIGTNAQKLFLGTVDLWGTGAAGRNNPFEPQCGFARRWATRLVPHALRGPFSAALLEEAGHGRPLALGDPAWLLPRLWPAPLRPPRFELGVVLHETEVLGRHPDAPPHPDFLRYHLPPSLEAAVRIISPLHRLDPVSMRVKLNEMLDCRRLLSTGLHGLVLAETYGIPCAAFDIHAGTSGRFKVNTDAPLDHRLRDFYAGIGQSEVLVLRTQRHARTDWEGAMRFLDREWSRVTFDPTPLLQSFPARYGRLSETHFPAGIAELQRRLSHVML